MPVVTANTAASAGSLAWGDIGPLGAKSQGECGIKPLTSGGKA